MNAAVVVELIVSAIVPALPPNVMLVGLTNVAIAVAVGADRIVTVAEYPVRFTGMPAIDHVNVRVNVSP